MPDSDLHYRSPDPERDVGKPRILERKYILPFALVTCLFVTWALAASLNDVLVRQFQKALDLSRGQSGLVQSAFYMGYFIGAVPAGLALRRFGYKRGMLIGLSLFVIGALTFYPAAELQTYAIFLLALYISAIGLAFLETTANPYVTMLGHPDTAAARLNLAQAFYGVGGILGPLIGGMFILSGLEYSDQQLAALTTAELDAYRREETLAVQAPYLFIASCITCLALLIACVRFPEFKTESAKGKIVELLRYRHLVWAVITQFMYVGAQVAVWSYFIDFTKEQLPDVDEKQAAFLLSSSLGLIIVGRFSGTFLMQYVRPQNLLGIYAIVCIALGLSAALFEGEIAVGSLWLISLFMSIMFPTVFALGIQETGELSKLASSVQIMAIVGGAVLPPLMGLAADMLGSIQEALFVPVIGFCFVLLFAVRGYKVKIHAE